MLTKCDKIENKELIERVQESTSCKEVVSCDSIQEQQYFSKKFFKLNQAIVDVIDNFSTVAFQPLDIQDEESIADCIYKIDSLVQYDEHRMPKDIDFEEEQVETDDL